MRNWSRQPVPTRHFPSEGRRSCRWMMAACSMLKGPDSNQRRAFAKRLTIVPLLPTRVPLSVEHLVVDLGRLRSAVFSVQARDSPIELKAHIGASGMFRASDTCVFSTVLYLLSYRGLFGAGRGNQTPNSSMARKRVITSTMPAKNYLYFPLSATCAILNDARSSR
jgi:hypothetical protein